MAAAAALAARGCRVELFESRRRLGGRAGSYVDPVDGSTIDNCQHVAMGCCTNFLDFCRQTGAIDQLERWQTLHFFGPDGRQCDFRSWKSLPAPLHLAPALLGLSYLAAADKIAIARAMRALVRETSQDNAGEPTVGEWLRGQRQSAVAVERFWKVVLVSALGESLERSSLSAARKVFVDGFLAHPDASDLWVPRVPLDELYDTRIARHLTDQGVQIHREAQVEAVVPQSQGCAVRCRGGAEQPFAYVVVAVPWKRVAGVLPPETAGLLELATIRESIAAAPIASVHLWFDRPLTELPHAILVERLSQWMFRRHLLAAEQGPFYYQVVISASYDLADRAKSDVIDEVVSDLRGVFHAASAAELVRARIVTDQDAVFSVRPGLDRVRPPQVTALPSLLLAGDWTQTGWPATMEGAVRSGYLAAEGVLAALGRPERLLVPDLPCGRLVFL